MARRVWLSILMPAVATALAVAWAVGCGPGVQAIYEGNVRFEHCYRLDLDPHIAPTHREACWREWTQLYTYGQTRDRVDYAERRMRELAAGDYSRPILNLQKTKGRPDIAPTAAPIPTSLHSPPPAVQKAENAPDGGADAAPPAPPSPKPPDTPCVTACKAKWRACSKPCEQAKHEAGAAADAGKAAQRRATAAARTAERKCRTCSENYRRCMQRCFK